MNPVIDRTKLLAPLILLMFFMLFFWVAIGKFHWDYTIWWIDMPMHFFGGFWEGLLFIWFFSIQHMASWLFLPFWELSLEQIDFKFILKTILFVLFIGILWEVFEFIASNKIGGDPFNTLDTISDIFFDLSGGLCAILYVLVPLENQRTSSKE